MAKDSNVLSQRLSKIKNQYKAFTETTYIPTGSLIMDTVMGGGLPVGKMIELASDAGAGKTTITLSICRELLKHGKKIVYLDHEGAVTTSQLHGIFGKVPNTDEYYADKWLWDADTNPDGNFFLFQVMTYSDSEQILNQLLGTGEITLVVVDSITSMVADEYLEDVEKPDAKDGKSITDQRPAVDAKLVGKFLKKFKAVCTRYDTTMILINQLRTNLNITGAGVSSKISTGGLAIEFFPDIRLRLEKPVPIYQTKKNNFTSETEKQQVGVTATIYAFKSKLGASKVKVPISILFGLGISNVQSFRLWLPNKMVDLDGEKVPMLNIKGGGYSVLTLKDGRQISLRGEDAVLKAIADNFEDIRSCFDSSDFILSESKALAEFDENGNRIFEVEPGEPFARDNKTGEVVEGFIYDDEEE